MQAVRQLAADMSAELGLDVYTFSVFHVYFEQYLTMGWMSARLLGAPAAPACLNPVRLTSGTSSQRRF